ncbi:SIMPL domain-containing protein [Christensenellaceae bacterium OttesenSCG-928-L17]|nr:SIMPL domain-containing protein [Christensenellaceae bacterium OttesenSCG-928-L17]
MKQSYKKKLALLVLAGILACCLLGCKTQEEIAQTQSQINAKTLQEIVIKQELEREQRLMKVTGMGQVAVDPDVATVSLSATVQGADAETVNANNEALMDEVYTAIKSIGVLESDIRAQEVVSPVYEVVKGVNEITGYTATNYITVRLYNVKRAGDLAAAIMQAGAEVLQIEYHLLDETTAYQEALAAAVEDANQKAAVMAGSAGVDLQGPVNIEENQELAKNINKVLVYESPALNTQEGEAEEGLSPAAIQASQITVSAEVVVEFQTRWPSTTTPAPVQ